MNREPALIASDDVRTQKNAEVSLFVFLVISLDKGRFSRDKFTVLETQNVKPAVKVASDFLIFLCFSFFLNTNPKEKYKKTLLLKVYANIFSLMYKTA